jgi:hypothetical protein
MSNQHTSKAKADYEAKIAEVVASILSGWHGSVTLVPDDGTVATTPQRYGFAVESGQHDVIVLWGQSDEPAQVGRHRFDRNSGQCIESSTGTMAKWRIAHWEMHRYCPEAATALAREQLQHDGKVHTTSPLSDDTSWKKYARTFIVKADLDDAEYAEVLKHGSNKPLMCVLKPSDGKTVAEVLKEWLVEVAARAQACAKTNSAIDALSKPLPRIDSVFSVKLNIDGRELASSLDKASAREVPKTIPRTDDIASKSVPPADASCADKAKPSILLVLPQRIFDASKDERIAYEMAMLEAAGLAIRVDGVTIARRWGTTNHYDGLVYVMREGDSLALDVARLPIDHVVALTSVSTNWLCSTFLPAFGNAKWMMADSGIVASLVGRWTFAVPYVKKEATPNKYKSVCDMLDDVRAGKFNKSTVDYSTMQYGPQTSNVRIDLIANGQGEWLVGKVDGVEVLCERVIDPGLQLVQVLHWAGVKSERLATGGPPESTTPR